MNCTKCKFYGDHPHNTSLEGWCERFPPIPRFVEEVEAVKSMWPIVSSDDVCGEFILGENNNGT
jgi:hypothetical protein